MADIGVWMRPEVLAHKLQSRRADKRLRKESGARSQNLQAWNLGRWPTRLSEPGGHRLFVASNGAWRGYFRLCNDALYCADDPRAPFTLLFDACSWTRIEPLPVTRFRSFTYRVPDIPHDARTQPAPQLHADT